MHKLENVIEDIEIANDHFIKVILNFPDVYFREGQYNSGKSVANMCEHLIVQWRLDPLLVVLQVHEDSGMDVIEEDLRLPDGGRTVLVRLRDAAVFAIGRGAPPAPAMGKDPAPYPDQHHATDGGKDDGTQNPWTI